MEWSRQRGKVGKVTADGDDKLESIVAVSIFAVRSRGQILVAWTRSSHLIVLVTHAGRSGGSVGNLEIF